MKLTAFDGTIYEFIRAQDRPVDCQPMEFLDEPDAYRFLRVLADDERILTALRSFVVEDMQIHTVQSIDDGELLKLLSTDLITHRAYIVSPGEHYRQRPIGTSDSTGSAEPAESADEEEVESNATPVEDTPPEEELTWIKFEIVNDETGEPVKGVSLKVKLPDGQTKIGKSDASGIIEFKDIPPGTCEIEKMVDADSLEVVTVE